MKDKPQPQTQPPCVVCAAFAPPPVSETKDKFLKGYSKPVASIYNVVLQELLVQQHFIRYNKYYTYNEVRGHSGFWRGVCARAPSFA